MALALRLDVKQAQSLVLTPQLQQAIRLLQLSSQELGNEIQRELTENPFLTQKEAIPAETTSRERRANGSSDRTSALSGRPEAAEQSSWNAPHKPAADQRLSVEVTGGRAAVTDPLARLTRPSDLREHIREQIAGIRSVNATITELARVLVDWLEEDGYLRERDDELAEQLHTDSDTIASARNLLQQCEPTGLAARDLRECLAIQLRDRDRLDPSMEKLLDRLPLLARADWSALERACGVDREDLREMAAEIKALDPRPGLSFAGEELDAVVPDVMIERGSDGRWRIELNSTSIPRLIVDQSYHAELRRGDLDDEAKAFVGERLQSASWLVRALDQRARTILRVAKAIFEWQDEYLDRGASALRPMVLKDIAQATGLHESTISRATHEKYVQTPHGTFNLKYFFTAAIGSTKGSDEHGAEAIRERIKQLIKKEDSSSVLSDDQLVEQLRADGVAIARRTVAKYRESLGIPSSVQRRRAKALAG